MAPTPAFVGKTNSLRIDALSKDVDMETMRIEISWNYLGWYEAAWKVHLVLYVVPGEDPD